MIPAAPTTSGVPNGTLPARRSLWAPQAWVEGGWQDNVLLEIDEGGRWARVQAGMDAPAQSTRVPGPVLPGLVNAHSHAFQRAFAGMAERREGAHDDFWSWRERMYAVALRIGPAELRAVAAQLYAEMLAGGYTQVCEFHYLHHAIDGRADPGELAMCRALAEAACETGIGLTLLPVLYERAGFRQPALREEQRRFRAGAEDVLSMRDTIRSWSLAGVAAGVAVHSLRAAAPASLEQLVAGLGNDPAPVHIHVAEQLAEVDDCVAATGLRPIEWLARHVKLDARWQLVHATHATPREIEAVARSGAGVVLCPSTEANLGDGLADVPRWLATGVPMAIGSDSHVSRHAAHELRLLEYGQRLLLRQRNVAADPEAGEPATAARLFERCLAGGAQAASGSATAAGLRAGARADLLVLDPHTPGLLGVPTSHLLDTLVFATDAQAVSQVWVGGRLVVQDGQHLLQPRLAEDFARALTGLMQTGPR